MGSLAACEPASAPPQAPVETAVSAKTPSTSVKPAASAPGAAQVADITDHQRPKLAADRPSADDVELMTRYRFLPHHVGYLVFDLTDGRPLAWRNATAGFMPASVAKIPTTVMALETLGPEHRLETRLVSDGVVSDGVLRGRLYLVGGGDPLLEPLNLARFVARLKALGIRRVEGGFHYDDTALPGAAAIDPSQPGDVGYNPGVSALSLAFNRIRLRWRRDVASGDVTAEAVAHSDRMEVPLNNVVLRAAPYRKDDWQAFYYDGQSSGDSAGPRWLISPRMGRKGRVWLPVKHPAAQTARVLRIMAARQGIALPAPSPGAAPSSAQVLYRHESRPLMQIIEGSLKFSTNLTAELVGMSAARALAGRPASLAASAHALAEWYRARLPDQDWTGFVLANHSGLSTQSRTSPAQFAAIVDHALDQTFGGAPYRSLLPYEAWPGNKRVRRPISIWAKSGTMDYARALAGQTQISKNRPLGFALFINDLAARRDYDADPSLRVPWRRAQARSWIRRARALEEALVRSWIEQFGKPNSIAEGAVSIPAR